jgi:hypothetical protein
MAVAVRREMRVLRFGQYELTGESRGPRVVVEASPPSVDGLRGVTSLSGTCGSLAGGSRRRRTLAEAETALGLVLGRSSNFGVLRKV